VGLVATCGESPEFCGAAAEGLIPLHLPSEKLGRERYQGMINQITDQLFLSQVVDVLGPEPVEALSELQALGITHVVSVCPEPDLIRKETALFELSNNCFQFYSQPVPTAVTRPDEDPWVKGLIQAIDAVNGILQKTPEAKILVHCIEGVDRSPFIVASIIAEQYGMQLNEAYGIVRSARPIIREHYEWLNN
jgi:protein-tyrosine phosphatase